MQQNISQFEIPVHNLILDESLKGVEDLHEVLYGFVLAEELLLLDPYHEIALVAVLEYEIDVVGGLL